MIAGIRERHHGTDSKTSPDNPTSAVSASSDLDECCQCMKSPEQLEFEEKELQFDITFENHLHNFVYVKQNSVYDLYS